MVTRKIADRLATMSGHHGLRQGIRWAVVAVVLAVFGASCGDDGSTVDGRVSVTTGDTSSTTAVPGPRSPAGATTTTLEETGAELVVVESGFSVWAGYDPGINAVAIVENRSDRTAVRPQLHVEFLDAAGTVIEDRDATLEMVVPPGRIAVTAGGPENTASMRMVFTVTEWTDTPPVEVTASEVELRTTGLAKVDVVGSLQNTSDESISAVEVIAVLRGGDGKLLGGSDNLDMPLGPRASAPFEVHFVGIPSEVARRVVTVEAYPVLLPT